MPISYPTTFEMPTTDGLTGLLTPFYFRHLLREELIPRAREHEEPLALFLLDTDEFLGVNTEHGHVAGDAVLEAVAVALREALPESAVICRYGGDEFSGALPDTRLDDAFTSMEELRRRISALRFERWPSLAISATIGLAAFPSHGASDVELIREAYEALYLGKVTGRNKVSLPPSDSRMVTKTSYYTRTQLERLAQLARALKRHEATLLREALDDVLKKYNDQFGAVPRG